MLKTVFKAIVLFPKTIYRTSMSIPHRLSPGKGPTLQKSVTGFTIYAILGIPITIAIFFEILIVINGFVVGETSNYHFSVTAKDLQQGQDVVLPGYYSKSYTEPNKENQQAYYNYLLAQYSPTIIHKTGHNPRWDIPTDVFFDGDKNPRNNVRNADKLSQLQPYLHGEVIAETEDSYYLAYMLYHIKDYDQPLRQLLTHWTYHDSDNEGFQLRIDKQTMKVDHVETWFHNRFFLCNSTGESSGSEPIQAYSLFEDKTHIVIYSQSMGHGVRCATRGDLAKLEKNVKIMRYEAAPDKQVIPNISRDTEVDITYQLLSLKPWYERAQTVSLSGSDADTLFEDKIHLGQWKDGKQIYVGRYIAGEDYDRNAWSRPKPPWSWDDKWDDIPIFVWHYYPSFAFDRHAGGGLSHVYSYNAPMLHTFGIENLEEILPLLELENSVSSSKKWANLQWRNQLVGQKDLWGTLNFKLKQYVNYIFNGLG
jgi:hypothetical protein